MCPARLVLALGQQGGGPTVRDRSDLLRRAANPPPALAEPAPLPRPRRRLHGAPRPDAVLMGELLAAVAARLREGAGTVAEASVRETLPEAAAARHGP